MKPKFVYPKPMPHGSFTAYSYYKCHCDLCSAFMAGYRKGVKSKAEPPQDKRQRTVKRKVITREQLPVEKKNPCGSADAYSFGCTCELCLTKGRKQFIKQAVSEHTL